MRHAYHEVRLPSTCSVIACQATTACFVTKCPQKVDYAYVCLEALFRIPCVHCFNNNELRTTSTSVSNSCPDSTRTRKGTISLAWRTRHLQLARTGSKPAIDAEDLKYAAISRHSMHVVNASDALAQTRPASSRLFQLGSLAGALTHESQALRMN